ncbi:hypothetical protein Micbo1qcDRAFT_156713, partial [Microdochium bolleyi]
MSAETLRDRHLCWLSVHALDTQFAMSSYALQSRPRLFVGYPFTTRKQDSEASPGFGKPRGWPAGQPPSLAIEVHLQFSTKDLEEHGAETATDLSRVLSRKGALSSAAVRIHRPRSMDHNVHPDWETGKGRRHSRVEWMTISFRAGKRHKITSIRSKCIVEDKAWPTRSCQTVNGTTEAPECLSTPAGYR